MVDVVILIPSTVISSAVLRREDEEIEGDNVCASTVSNNSNFCLF